MGCQEWLIKVCHPYQGSVRPALHPKTVLQGFIRWFASCGIFLGEIPLNPGVKKKSRIIPIHLNLLGSLGVLILSHHVLANGRWMVGKVHYPKKKEKKTIV